MDWGWSKNRLSDQTQITIACCCKTQSAKFEPFLLRRLEMSLYFRLSSKCSYIEIVTSFEALRRLNYHLACKRTCENYGYSPIRRGRVLLVWYWHVTVQYQLYLVCLACYFTRQMERKCNCIANLQSEFYLLYFDYDILYSRTGDSGLGPESGACYVHSSVLHARLEAVVPEKVDGLLDANYRQERWRSNILRYSLSKLSHKLL